MRRLWGGIYMLFKGFWMAKNNQKFKILNFGGQLQFVAVSLMSTLFWDCQIDDSRPQFWCNFAKSYLSLARSLLDLKFCVDVSWYVRIIFINFHIFWNFLRGSNGLRKSWLKAGAIWPSGLGARGREREAQHDYVECVFDHACVRRCDVAMAEGTGIRPHAWAYVQALNYTHAVRPLFAHISFLWLPFDLKFCRDFL